MEREYITTVTQKGQVTIPIELRKALNINPKDKVAFRLDAGEIRIRHVGSQLLAGYGAGEPMTRPEDFRRIRREVEEEIADRSGEGR